MALLKNSSPVKFNILLPKLPQKNIAAQVCSHCNYVNKTPYSFCTNCGYPLKENIGLVDAYHARLNKRMKQLFKAESAVTAARLVLYLMASFLLLGVLFIFSNSESKYVVVMLALLLASLFYFLAFWSRKNPFTAMLTAFIILTTFTAVNFFGKLVQSFTTTEGVIGLFMCIALLFVVLRGVQGAYRVTIIKEGLL